MTNDNIDCPDIRKLDPRPRYNFNLDRCLERFRLQSDGCVKCEWGRFWFIERMMGNGFK